MTVEECAKRMLEHFMPGMQSRGSPQLEAAKAADAVIVDLHALIYTESTRAAARCNQLGDEFMAKSKGEPVNWYNRSLVEAGPCYELRDEILATSPGELGG